MVKVNEAFPGKFLKGADIGETTPTWTIDAVSQEEMQDGSMKWCLYFEGEQKPLVLNVTNANAVAAAYGDEMDDWPGKRVTLFTMPVSFQGKITDSIRLRVPKKRPTPTPAAPKKTVAEEIDDELPDHAA